MLNAVSDCWRIESGTTRHSLWRVWRVPVDNNGKAMFAAEIRGRALWTMHALKKSREFKDGSTRGAVFRGAHLKIKAKRELKMKTRRWIIFAHLWSPEVFHYPTSFLEFAFFFVWITWNYLAYAQASRILTSSARLQVTDSSVNDRRNRRVLITGQSTHFLFGRAFPDYAEHHWWCQCKYHWNDRNEIEKMANYRFQLTATSKRYAT